MIATRGSARAARVQAGARETGLWPRALQICRAAGLEICRKPSPRQPCPRRPQGAAPRAKAPHARAPCAALPWGHPSVSTPVFCLAGGASPIWSQFPTGPAAQWPPQPQTTPVGTVGVWAVPRRRAGRGPGRVGPPLEQSTACLKCPTKCSRVIKEQTEQASGSIHILGNVYLEGSHQKMFNSWFVSSRQDKARCS